MSRSRLYVETGASVGVAALLGGAVPGAAGPTVCVLTGGNMDLEQVADLLRRPESEA